MSFNTTDPRELRPYGAWESAISAEALVDSQVRFENLRSIDGQLYWTENVPTAGGAHGLFRLSGGGVTPVVAAERNVRSRVHEYGTAPYVVVGETVYFTQFADQRLYRLEPGQDPQALTPEGYRYADCVAQHTADGRVSALIGVREDHTDPRNVRNALVRIPLPAGGAGEVLYADSDFVAYPRLSPDGRQLAFITWQHPNMPWDATEMKVAQLNEQGLTATITVAGAPAQSVLEPQWDADGALYFISDHSGFWNLYGWSDGKVRALWPCAAEFARPLWNLGQANYALLDDDQALARFGADGIDRLAVIDLQRGTTRVLDLPYVAYDQLTRLDAHRVALIASSASAPQALLCIDVRSGEVQVLRSAGRALLGAEAVSVAVPIRFPSARGRTAHAFFYAPVNPGYQAPANERPPLLTLVHGGPTTQASPAFSAAVQYWTSRGIAVVDVNYAGSSGYGRAYRRELNGNWGIVDVEDVIAAVRYLSQTGRVDPKRTAIRGGSAGGYTVLLALCTSDVFHAGADYYGISDMSALARDTHKFESRYLDSLIGPLPEAQSVYDDRSPLQRLDGFKVPLIVLQGAEDPIVPPNQSELIVEALRARGAPVAYLLYPGEGHGFRKPENIVRSLQAELSFYGQVFGFTPADPLPPLLIENLRSTSE